MFRTMLVFSSFLLALAGCGPSNESSSEADAPPSNTAQVAIAAGPERRRGPMRSASAPIREPSEHPDEPRRAADEPNVFRSAGRTGPPRVSSASSFQPESGSTTPVFFGLMHAHTMYSDGSGTPEEAFSRARAAGLDFMAVTAHNHSRAEGGADETRRDRVLIATNTDLYDSPDPVTFTRRLTINGIDQMEDVTAESLITAANDVTQTDFVAFFGQEFSTISSGNHINVIGAESVLTIGNGEFDQLYTELADVGPGESPPVLQMNHPDIHRDLFYMGANQDVIDKMFNDYGFDEFDRDFEELVSAADPLVALVEVLTGPAMDEELHPTFHYPSRLVHANDFYFYLIQGFHISPSVGQDNHYSTWGDSTPARMGVLAPELTRIALVDAMHQNHTYATEDSDLRLEFSINGEQMGGVITLAADDPLNIQVHVSDPTEPTTSYVTELFYGDVVPQDENSLNKWILDDGLAETFSFSGDGVLTFDEYLASGEPEFFFVSIQQSDGDRAWSAPVWINHPRQ